MERFYGPCICTVSTRPGTLFRCSYGTFGLYTDFTDEDLFEVVEALYDENPAQAIHYPLIRVQVSFTDGYQIVRHVLNEATIRRASKTMVGDVRISDYLLNASGGWFIYFYSNWFNGL